jgi:hypothetical protein
MAPVYSTLLWDGYVSTSDTVNYEVPEGYRAVVRDVVGYPPSFHNIAPQGLTLQRYSTSSPILVWGTGYIQPGRHYHWEGRQVVNALDIIVGVTAATSEQPWALAISGYLLTLP